MKKIFIYLKPYYLRMSFGLLIKLLGTFMDLGLPWVLAFIIDNIIPKNEISLILWWGVVMILLSVGARVFNVLANRMASRVARDTVRSLRYDLFRKILSLSGTQLDHFTIPSLESRMTSDTYNIHNMIGMMQRIGVRAPIILIGGIIITSTLEPVLTLVLVGVLPLLFYVVYLVSKKGIPIYTQLQLSMDHLVRVVRENISGIRVIKALSKTRYEKARFSSVNADVMEKELRAGTIMAVTNPAMNLLLNTGMTMVIIVGAFRVNSGASMPGKILAFLSYFAIILHAVMAITRIFVVYSKAIASAGRIAEVLDTEEDLVVRRPEEIEAENPKDKDEYPDANSDNSEAKKYNQETKKYNPEAKKYNQETKMDDKYTYHIEFSHVSFAYTSKPCIIDISFGIKKGESLGIIGSTGAGKTTLVNLLLRFYDVIDGSITIDGTDIRSIDKQELRRKFGVVFQNDVLFADRIYENISLGREIPVDRVKEAVEDAQAASFVNELENELDFRLAIKGSNLSGGQKQRLLVSRALAGEPQILILDDSSSALDYKTDSMLRKAIRENYKGTTSIVIAQRVSSVMKLNRILVIEDGQMAGYGTHEELLKYCEVYKEIYQSQMMS